MTKISESIEEIWALTKIAVVINGIVLIAIGFCEQVMQWFSEGLSAGYLIGSITMLCNLHILGRGFAPIIHAGQGGGLALASSLASVFFLGVSAFAVFNWMPNSLIGFALGFISLSFIGIVYAYRTAVRELSHKSWQSPG